MGRARRGDRPRARGTLPGRVRALVAIAALAVLAGAAGAGRAGGESRAARSAFHVGDSLAAGTSGYLAAELPGWRLRQQARVGLQSAAVPPLVRRLGPALPRVLVVSAGTNGSPGAVAAFTAVVRDVLRLAGRGRCVVWANVVRPPAGGVGYGRLNRTLAALARRQPTLRVLDWAALVRAHPGWLRADGVHALPAGYRGRARALAALVRGCP